MASPRIAPADLEIARAALAAAVTSEMENRPLTSDELVTILRGIEVLRAALLEAQRKRNTQAILAELRAAALSTSRGFAQFPVRGLACNPGGPVRPPGGA